MSLVSVCVSVCACNGSRHCDETRTTPCRRPRAERTKRLSRLGRVPGSARGSGHSGLAQGRRLGSLPPPLVLGAVRGTGAGHPRSLLCGPGASRAPL